MIYSMSKLHHTHQDLVNDIGELLKGAKYTALKQVDNILVKTYWNIGKYLIEYEQRGKKKAEYGMALIDSVSRGLKEKHGRGFSRSNIQNMRLFYLRFPNCQTVSSKLSWSHYVELLSITDELAFSFYLKQSQLENWSVRELKRQIKSSLFERLALSKNKRSIIELSQKGQLAKNPKDIIKDPYIFEFLQIPEKKSMV